MKINTRNPLDPRTIEETLKLPVLSSIATPPTSPNNGDRHRIIATATGVWTGKEDQIAIYEASNETWFYETYSEGSIVYDLDANDFRYVKNDLSWEQFDKIAFAISDITGLQSALDTHTTNIGSNLTAIGTKEPLLPSKTGESLKFLRVNVAEDGFEYAEAGGSVDPDSITNTEIASHTSTKITITAKGQLNSSQVYEDESNVSTVSGDFLQPSVDNEGNIGIPSKRYASVRAVLIQSGDLILSDKKTGKALYVIDEDKEGITFKTFRGKKMMKILKNGDLLIRGKIKEGIRF